MVAPYNDPEAAASIVDREWRDIAAVIVEPVQRYYAAEPGFLETLRRVCDARGIVLIYDEVVTGFRHALGGAAELTGIEPDLSVFGKALGGGLPVSAVAGREEVMSHGDPKRGGPEDGYCYVTSSQAGNPLGCAAALATLNELSRPGVMQAFHRFAEDLKAGLRDITGRQQGAAAAQVVGSGPLWDIVFAEGPIRDHRAAARADSARHRRFHLGLVEQGVMVRIGGRSYFSTAHREREVEFTLRAAEAALRAATR
ncbi:MAG: aminotransferase class III-fold pyridoxal phosphate-dependent enzyme [Gemmatimonadetes bacterium]|nr:aminotransferase class III-fold pyridoxal phosphate-dependent enzyme [Gemmatimonadota bacterium]